MLYLHSSNVINIELLYACYILNVLGLLNKNAAMVLVSRQCRTRIHSAEP